MAVFASAVMADVYHVDADATDPLSGLDWCSAFRELQPALEAAGASDQIRIADGTYLPDATGPGDRRDATFRLKNGVMIVGGYAGCGAADPDDRSPEAFPTILSGDLRGDDEPGFVNVEDNAFHVVTSSNTDATAVLDGVVISGGHATEFPDNRGAGLINVNGSPTLISCIFRHNRAEGDQARGGGMYSAGGAPRLTDCVFDGNSVEAMGGGIASSRGGGLATDSSNAVLERCEFRDNTAIGFSPGGAALYISTSDLMVTDSQFERNVSLGLGATGGAILNSAGSQPTFERCSFFANRSSGNGFQGGDGGAWFNFGNPRLTDCTFVGNVADVHGGAMYNSGASPELINGAFNGNLAGASDNGSGGALFNGFGSAPSLLNCTLSHNVASSGKFGNGLGGGLYNFGGSIPSSTNSILWANEDFGGIDSSAQIHNDSSSGTNDAIVNYSCVQGGWTGGGGVGNISDDPELIDPLGIDGVAGTGDENLRPSWNSPVIDAGDDSAVTVATDLDGNSRLAGAAVDLGAYEVPGAPAGTVPDGARNPGQPLILTKAGGSSLDLAWGESCLSTDLDYAVFEGELGDYTSHVSHTCSTGGEIALTLESSAGSRYYLVVPIGAGTEGSYGVDSFGAERQQSLQPCLPQMSTNCP